MKPRALPCTMTPDVYKRQPYHQPAFRQGKQHGVSDSAIAAGGFAHQSCKAGILAEGCKILRGGVDTFVHQHPDLPGVGRGGRLKLSDAADAVGEALRSRLQIVR